MCENGDVKLDSDDIPMIFWDGKWSRICGHYFWDNNIGATMFCKKLNYDSGTILESKYHSAKPGFWIGQCLHGDKFPYCTGRCSDMFGKIGGRCSTGFLGIGSICDVKDHKVAAVKCYGRNGKPSKC